MIDYIAYLIVWLANKISAVIPISLSLWFGRRIGTIAFLLNKKRRLISYSNLKAAFAREKSPKELKAITKRVYQNMVQTFMEVLNLTKINRKYVDKYIDIVNIERLHKAARSGRGTILLTAHFGDWELSSLTSAVIGYPIHVLAREQKMKRLNGLLNALREFNGCKVITKGMATKNVLKVLYDKQIVGILSDQDAGKLGTFVDFFGRPTSCHSGPFEIAKRTNSTILPNFNVRTKGPYHKICLEEYIDVAKAPGGDDIKEALQAFTKLLESYVRRYPDQWLWLHKRWKSTPTRTVLVLNDGKAGHLNQSMAVCGQIRRVRVDAGYKPDDTKTVVVDVRYKNEALKNLLSVCASFASWRCHGCMRCMKLCLEKKTYETLMKTYSDFVVSCGSSLSAVNVFVAKENNAKNIVVMKPGIAMGLGKFSLAIIPKHDTPPKRKNVVQTHLAPNLIDEETLKKDGEALAARIGPGRNEAVGLFVGGDNPEFALTEGIITRVLDSILRFCGKTGAELLVTTSRRTSGRVASVLKDRLKGDPVCRLLVIANEKNLDGAVGGILALSRTVIVSEDSISMVSEAISSGKRVVLFNLEKKGSSPTKYERAINDLKEEGYCDIAGADNLEAALERAWREGAPAGQPKDREVIRQAIRRII